MQWITAQTLTADAFAPYGQVVESGAHGVAINGGHAWRSEAGTLALQAAGGWPVLAVFRVHGRAVQGPWQALERHRLGSQTFLPLGDARCLVLVAHGAHQPAPTSLAAFVTRRGQGWTLSPGTWHHSLIALADDSADRAANGAPIDVAVLERGANTVDCDMAMLEEPVCIDWPPGP